MKNDILRNAALGAIIAPAIMGSPVSAGEMDMNASQNSSGSLSSLGSDWREYFSLSATASARYDNNIYLQDTDEESDVIATFAPAIAMANDSDTENTWSFSYTPTARFYLDHSENDGLDHNVNVGIYKKLPKTSFGFDARYSNSSGSNRYAAGQIDQEVFDFQLGVTRVISEKTRLDLDANYNASSFNTLIDRDKYSLKLAAQYQATAKIQTGPYLSYEHVAVSDSPDHDAISAGLQSSYQATGKTAFSGSIGWENRQFEGASASSDDNYFTMAIGATHAYSEKTSFSANLYRNANAGYLQPGQAFIATGLDLGASYQASERLRWLGSVGIEDANYFRTSTLAASAPDRKYYFLSVGATYSVGENWQLGSTLQLRKNESDSSDVEYDNCVLSASATYSF